ncbi:hypothetical protein L228DRAFT_236843 [Xylona heveae TC161]|uniref:Uncharacterized protein n=1 Tax=Xylona heveae (strain CBS 132557 / TC161) TaxID=1328760 RepID=A0A165J632_XYLHT|nr:hypothetical protein L228DRAFT_236843 [Xylona heveae TC161]KZF25783.1 hypothetical protein L228DRAFT_236843 [Xylona heveae TC161]
MTLQQAHGGYALILSTTHFAYAYVYLMSKTPSLSATATATQTVPPHVQCKLQNILSHFANKVPTVATSAQDSGSDADAVQIARLWPEDYVHYAAYCAGRQAGFLCLRDRDRDVYGVETAGSKVRNGVGKRGKRYNTRYMCSAIVPSQRKLVIYGEMI